MPTFRVSLRTAIRVIILIGLKRCVTSSILKMCMLCTALAPQNPASILVSF
ncbi:hypothetical protein Hanom_Chr15g01399871 [Helianthus anomalus]